jgi:hypothetical protein
MKKLIPLLAAWATIAGAQSPPGGDASSETGPPPLYTVEVIVFAYTENVSVGSEIFVPDAPPVDQIPEYGDTPVDEPRGTAGRQSWVVVPQLDVTTQSRGRSAGPREFVLLQEDELELGNMIDRFRRLDVYETLMHFGWTQQAYPEEETPPIDLRLFGTPPPGLDGTLTLYLSRFLHLVVDMALDAPEQFEKEVIEDESFYSFGDDRPQYDDVYSRRVMPVRFRIQEDRILKNGELRYFDHPKFGLLAKVTRVETPGDGER